jgi:redox-sensitive bicupin YhaK (pirin superfamily)
VTGAVNLTCRALCQITRLVSGVTAIACLVAVLACDGAPSQRTEVEVIRRDQLALLSIDDGRTRVLYTSSLVEPGVVGYQKMGALLVFAYDEVQPGSGFKRHAHDNVEVITIVLEGSLDHEDTAGNSGRVNAGEVALMSAGSGVKHSEFGNPDVLTRSVTIWLKPRTMNKKPHRATATPVERNGWHVIAAEHGAPLIVEQDAVVQMKRVAPGGHVSVVAQPGRIVYLAAVEGELVAGDQQLSAPERLILRAGGLPVVSEAGATVVVVDVALAPSAGQAREPGAPNETAAQQQHEADDAARRR